MWGLENEHVFLILFIKYVQINARMLYFDTKDSEIHTCKHKNMKRIELLCQKLTLQFEIPEVYLLLALSVSDI